MFQKSSLLKTFFNMHKYIQKSSFHDTTSRANIYIAKSNNIIYNLCTEEYFYEHNNIDKPILFLYQNDKNVVIGKHQNPWKECNINQMEQEKIELARRRSGGGAVYQDLGNLCFSFLLPHDSKVDFKKINTQIILNSLNHLGITAEFSGRNDIIVEGRKISGSAFKINLPVKKFGPKCLHHGTILLNVDLSAMKRYLNPNKLKLISKGVDSVQSRVLNLNEKYPNLNKDILFEVIEKEFLKYHGIDQNESKKFHIEDISNNKIEKINEMFIHYNSWDWKFGECPEFTNSLSYKFDFGLIDLSLKVERGIIEESIVYSDSLLTELIDSINLNLKDLKAKFVYDKEGIGRLLQDVIDKSEVIQNNPYYVTCMENMKDILSKQI